MSESGANNGGGSAGDGRSVLGSLPATRPARIGRRGPAPTPKKPAAAKKPATAARKPAAKKPAAAAAKKPTAAAQKPAPTPRKPAPAAEALPGGPRAVRPAAPQLDRPGSERPPASERVGGPPSGTELVTTAIQAAGELAQIGLTVGGQILKRTLGRVPKP